MPLKKRIVYYGVYDASGEHCRVFTNWDEAKEHIAGIKNVTGEGAKYKKFFFESDANYFARWGQPPPEPTVSSVSPNSLVVYTDGSATMDMKTGIKRAGIGVFFGHKHPLNVADAFREPPLTNNRAELMAIRRAMEIIADPANDMYLPHADVKPHVVIFTDSSYSRDALGAWRSVWTANNFRDNTILNRDVIEPTWQLMDTFFARSGRTVTIVWTKGHCGIIGNERADELAEEGAAKS